MTWRHQKHELYWVYDGALVRRFLADEALAVYFVLAMRGAAIVPPHAGSN